MPERVQVAPPRGPSSAVAVWEFAGPDPVQGLRALGARLAALPPGHAAAVFVAGDLGPPLLGLPPGLGRQAFPVPWIALGPAVRRVVGAARDAPVRLAQPTQAGAPVEAVHGAAPGDAAVTAVRIGRWESSWTDAEHAAACVAVQRAIGRGAVYQVNIVGHRWAPVSGQPDAVRAHLDARLAPLASPVWPRRFVSADGSWSVHTATPELALRVDAAGGLRVEPIKGTGVGAAALRGSAKDRAEHVMIVDLMRNDLAAVAATGSVRVPTLYALRRWGSLLHAVSVVTARRRADATTADVLAALVPFGSVTGAPKRAAVELLGRLEPVRRGPAMGALGWGYADGSLDLGLTIRTVGYDAAASRLHLWAGGGVTWGSDPAAEVAEAHAKAGVVLDALAAGAGGSPGGGRTGGW